MAQDIKVFTEADVDNMWERLEYGRDGLPVVGGVPSRVPRGWRNNRGIRKIGAGGASEVFRRGSKVGAQNERTYQSTMHHRLR